MWVCLKWLHDKRLHVDYTSTEFYPKQNTGNNALATRNNYLGMWYWEIQTQHLSEGTASFVSFQVVRGTLSVHRKKKQGEKQMHSQNNMPQKNDLHRSHAKPEYGIKVEHSDLTLLLNRLWKQCFQ